MVGTVIFMERLSDSLSKPVASLTARPMTTRSMVGRRPPRPLLPPQCALEIGGPSKGWRTTWGVGMASRELWAAVHG
jgi:hypothetical protein